MYVGFYQFLLINKSFYFLIIKIKMFLNYNYFHLDIFSVFLLSLILLSLGFCGIFVIRSNLIITLISLEVVLFTVNLNFIVFSAYLDDVLGQIFALLVLSVAAAESSIGLALLVAMFRVRGIISIDYLNTLKG
jgi:NADH-quinone oxidoreductase subunit K